MKANANDIARALDGGAQGKVRFFLLYGPDEAGSQALARRLERAMGPDAERIDLDAAGLKSDPARLRDEASSISLFGGRQWVRIQPAADDITDAVAGLLDAETAGNPVIAIAGALRPTSSLVKLALAHPLALAHASYVPDARDAGQIAETLGRELGLRLPRDVARTLAAACDNDRSIMAQEIEKLALYLDAAPDRPTEATSEALAAIIALSNEGEIGKVVDAIMSGHPARVAVELARLEQSGINGIPILRALFRRTMLLLSLRQDMAAGLSASAAVEARGKAIHFREKATITDQAARWMPDHLASLADKLMAQERLLKSSRTAGDILADAEFITVARFAQRQR